MANSTRRATISKTDKPRPDFPLCAPNNGQWAKKVCGRMRFFGVWADPQAALNTWLDQKDIVASVQLRWQLSAGPISC